MEDKDKTSVQISKSGLRKLGQLAKIYRRSATQQLEWMIDTDLAGLSAMGVVSVTTLPHPSDSEGVSVAYVEKQEG